MAAPNFDRFFNSLSERLEKPVRSHLRNVYSCLAATMIAAATGAYVHVVTDYLKGNFLSAIASIGLLILLGATPPTSTYNQKMRLGFLLGFGFFTGLGMGPLLDAVISINPSIIPTAFLSTCVIFGCFTLSALYCEQRKWLYIGGLLMSGLSFMLLLSIFNLFFQSRLMFQVNLYLGMAVMCAFVLYDTQLIVEKRRRGDTDYIWHCVDLFLDFINIFRQLLIILAQKEEGSRQKKRD
ncbi:PREDICTED: bax inhibitor 1-like isoform X1 [Priapulus caudatus]|uniref:Bax inhibitor 1-like isoform X1 n=1 Tax=Priapulus caudatus TaxID=37621 RepID=A0ABM1FC18_PRICU|nr:PREDICTED: bax inhibitor 1-like isoform X1 [Priapulus caudatus]